jgi:hypothetical protein
VFSGAFVRQLMTRTRQPLRRRVANVRGGVSPVASLIESMAYGLQKTPKSGLIRIENGARSRLKSVV